MESPLCRHARACRGHPRLPPPYPPPHTGEGREGEPRKTWMAGTSPAMTPNNRFKVTGPRSNMSIERRRFVLLLGSAIMAAPRAAAGQARELPLIGFLHAATAESYAFDAAGFAQGLEEQGFVEAQNIAVDYRFASGRLDHLAMLAADLV